MDLSKIYYDPTSDTYKTYRTPLIPFTVLKTEEWYAEELKRLAEEDKFKSPTSSDVGEGRNDLPIKNPFEKQVGGDHYKTMKIQPIEYILANNLGFCEANIVKYITRYKQKGGIQDVKKVIHYAELLLASLERDLNDAT